MILRNLRFALNSAWQSFWRNLAVSLAAVVSITLILILAGVNLLVGHAFSQVLDGFKTKVSEMSINIADDTPLTTVYTFRDQLAADPRVASVKFVTKDEALKQFESDPNNAALVEQVDGNPLDAKLVVQVKSLSDVSAIDALARQWPGVDPTNPTNYQGDFVNRMLHHMDDLGARRVTPQLRPEDREEPWLEWVDVEYFNPNYLMRSMHLMPKRLDKPEWRHTQDYWAERDELPLVDLDDGCLVFE